MNTPPRRDGRPGPLEDVADDIPTNLLGEVLSLPPRMASRTISQIQASQRLLSLLTCRSTTSDPEDDVVAASSDAPSEPVDVLELIADRDLDADPEDSVAGEPTDPTEPEAQPDSEEWVPAVDELVIPGYQSLAASQVIPRLTTLAPDELSAIAAYEEANRRRRTILNRVQQLLGPVDGAG